MNKINQLHWPLIIGLGALARLCVAGEPKLPANVEYGGKLPTGKDITEIKVAAWIHEDGVEKSGICRVDY